MWAISSCDALPPSPRVGLEYCTAFCHVPLFTVAFLLSPHNQFRIALSSSHQTLAFLVTLSTLSCYIALSLSPTWLPRLPKGHLHDPFLFFPHTSMSRQFLLLTLDSNQSTQWRMRSREERSSRTWVAPVAATMHKPRARVRASLFLSTPGQLRSPVDSILSMCKWMVGGEWCGLPTDCLM